MSSMKRLVHVRNRVSLVANVNLGVGTVDGDVGLEVGLDSVLGGVSIDIDRGHRRR